MLVECNFVTLWSHRGARSRFRREYCIMCYWPRQTLAALQLQHQLRYSRTEQSYDMADQGKFVHSQSYQPILTCIDARIIAPNATFNIVEGNQYNINIVVIDTSSPDQPPMPVRILYLLISFAFWFIDYSWTWSKCTEVRDSRLTMLLAIGLESTLRYSSIPG